jgi:pimeloyl-ACP methyl ester carboxylesterase
MWEDDAIIGLCGISTDITERKQMEKELFEAKEMAEAAQATLIVLQHCGHMMPMEEPEQLGLLVDDWLAKNNM